MQPAEHAPGPDFTVRLIRPGDGPAYARLLQQVSPGDRRFFKQNLDNPDTAVSDVLRDDRTRRVVAVRDGQILGTAAAVAGVGWSSHVAELQVLVASGHRRNGVGRALARASLAEALKLDCTHTYVEVVAEQEGLVAMFQDLGFLPEALLPDFVRDSAGELHDLMLLTYRADQSWGQRQVLGLDEVTS